MPRSLTRNPLWEAANPKYKVIFTVILDHSLFVATQFDDHGVILDLHPGQFCASLEELARLSGKQISKLDVQRGLVRLRKYGFLMCEVIHVKTVITITHPDTYDLICKISDTKNDSVLMQERSEKDSERKKEMNEENEKKEFARSAAPPRNTKNQIIFSFERRQYENIQPGDIQTWKTLYPAANLEREMLKMTEWCLANLTKSKSKKLWRKLITGWLSRANEEAINKEAKTQNRSKSTVLNRDTTDSSSNKTFDFSEDV